MQIKIILALCLATATLNGRITIMLDPAGDAKQTGRTIDDTFERSVTLQLADAIKKKLETDNDEFRIILTRFPGQIVEPRQHANFANRLHVDLYVSLLAYGQTDPARHLFLYHYLENPVTDYWNNNTEVLEFIPYDQAHKKNALQSKTIAHAIKTNLVAFESLPFTVAGVYGIPFKPLVGIIAPAIGIECGLAHKGDWSLYVDHLTQALKQVAQTLLRKE